MNYTNIPTCRYLLVATLSGGGAALGARALTAAAIARMVIVRYGLGRQVAIKRKAIVGLTMVLICSGHAHAAVVSYHCSFPTYSDPSGLRDQVGFGFEIQYDDISHNAFIVGNVGMSPATPIVGSDSSTFIEVTPTGAVMTTTIDNEGATVHSRHTVILGNLSPSQHYGNCIVGN